MELNKQAKAAIQAAITDPKAAQSIIEVLEASLADQIAALEARVVALEEA